MAFYPNQIKLTTNTNPTENADIRYALSSTRTDGVDLIDNYPEKQYNKKYFKFLHKNFPTEKESGSEAHRLAVWWTRQPDSQTGDRTLISMNDRWYLVERFDDADNNYQVEGYITKAEFEEVFKELQEYGRSGKVKSISGSVDFIDKLNKQGYSLKGKKSSSLGYATQFGREDNQIQRMDKKQVERGKRIANDGDGYSSGGGANKQGKPITQSYALKGSDKVMTELPDDRVTVKDVLRGKATKEQLSTQVKGGLSEQSEAVKVLMTNAQVALERSHRSDSEGFYKTLRFKTFEELREKMREWNVRYNNRPHSQLLDRNGKRKWWNPIQKRNDLLAILKEYREDC